MTISQTIEKSENRSDTSAQMEVNEKKEIPMNKTTITIPSSIWQNPWHFIAFGFGSGALPVAPGTWGTVVGVIFYLLIADLNIVHYLLITGILFAFGTWLCHFTSKEIGVHDHPGMVIDEIVGYLITMIAAPKGFGWIVLGFVLFRIFDIFKPWPISWADRKFQNGFGVMFDDLLAAIPACIIIQILALFIK